MLFGLVTLFITINSLIKPNRQYLALLGRRTISQPDKLGLNY
jgi:hypothetical protein